MDINENKLSETCTQLKAKGYTCEVFSYVVDCSKQEEVYEVAERVKEEVGNVSVLVNNAGLMNGKSILQLSDEDISRSIGINLLAHFWVRSSIKKDIHAVNNLPKYRKFGNAKFKLLILTSYIVHCTYYVHNVNKYLHVHVVV